MTKTICQLPFPCRIGSLQPATTAVVFDSKVPRCRQLHIVPYVVANPPYTTTLTPKANVLEFHPTFYLCIALCKTDFTTVA
jgi:hypothetical protein